MIRDSMVFYRSFYEATKRLPAEEFKEAVLSILDYALDGKVPETEGIGYTVFCMAKPQIDVNNSRYQNGIKGGKKKAEGEPSDNQTETKAEPSGNQSLTNTEHDASISKKKEIKEKTFVPPALDEVMEYCTESGYMIDAQRFIDFYESKDWMIGMNRMKNWKAAVRKWSRQKETVGMEKPKNQFQSFPQRDVDYDTLIMAGLKGET